MSLVDVIKYEGDNQTFVWKHPREDFNTGSQLIVHESQEAIFFLNGQALDSFLPGRYELETQNIPLLNKIINIPSGGESPFHAEVYFINLVEQMGIPWGTNSKIQFMEPEFMFPLSIGVIIRTQMCRHEHDGPCRRFHLSCRPFSGMLPAC